MIIKATFISSSVCFLLKLDLSQIFANWHLMFSFSYVCYRGLWNTPYVSTAILINATLFQTKALRPIYKYQGLDPDMSFCAYYRDMVMQLILSKNIPPPLAPHNMNISSRRIPPLHTG